MTTVTGEVAVYWCSGIEVWGKHCDTNEESKNVNDQIFYQNCIFQRSGYDMKERAIRSKRRLKMKCAAGLVLNLKWEGFNRPAISWRSNFGNCVGTNNITSARSTGHVPVNLTRCALGFRAYFLQAEALTTWSSLDEDLLY